MVYSHDQSNGRAPYVDVTAIYALPRTTGIQRVVRDIVGDGKALNMVRFSKELGGYVAVDHLPELKPRDESEIARRMRKLTRRVLFSGWVLFGTLAPKLGLVRLYSRARKLSSRIYSSSLSDSVLTGTSDQASRDNVVEMSVTDYLWLLDIPKTADHVNFLIDTIKATSCRFGVYVYDMIPVDHPDLIGGPAAEEIRREYLNYLRLVPLASTVFFLSEFTRSRYLAFAEENKVPPPASEQVVYPPIALAGSPEPPSDSHQLPAQLKRFLAEGNSALKLFCVSPLNKRKNVKVALKAFELLAQHGKLPTFLLVTPTLSSGDSETATLLNRLVKKYPTQLLVVAEVTDSELATCYRSTDIVLMPSVVEGFGLPTVEGIHHGCHVIASQESSFIELGKVLPIELLPSDDAKAWADSIMSLSGRKPPRVDLHKILPSPSEFREMMASI